MNLHLVMDYFGGSDYNYNTIKAYLQSNDWDDLIIEGKNIGLLMIYDIFS